MVKVEILHFLLLGSILALFTSGLPFPDLSQEESSAGAYYHYVNDDGQ